VQVDAVDQRTGEPRLIVGGAACIGRALAGESGLVGAPAAARVHGGDQHEARGIGHAVVGARDRDLAGLERLAQRVEHLRLELGQFVEEEHAVMGERHLPRPRAQPAADQRRHAGGMVRGAERPAVGERAAIDLAGDRGDHRDFEQFLGRERRQDGRKSRRQHRLARAGRADHQQVVAAGGGDLESALGAFLTLDVLEVDQCAVELADLRLRAGEHLRAADVIGELDQRGSGNDLHLRARPGGLGAAGGRADEAFAARIGANRRRQYARDRGDRAVEPELAQHGEARERIRRNGADRSHQAEGDGEIVVTAFLREVCGREVDGDAARRQRQAGGNQRCAHPLTRLRHGLVRQTDDIERREPWRHLHLDIDGAGLDTLERHRRDPLDHGSPCSGGSLAEADGARQEQLENSLRR
jgi:hypothetical protein